MMMHVAIAALACVLAYLLGIVHGARAFEDGYRRERERLKSVCARATWEAR